jgi:hypothetical protein
MSRNDLEEPETWAVRTFGQAELGDLRRTDRLVQLAAALARNPQSSLPGPACEERPKQWEPIAF